VKLFIKLKNDVFPAALSQDSLSRDNAERACAVAGEGARLKVISLLQSMVISYTLTFFTLYLYISIFLVYCFIQFIYILACFPLLFYVVSNF